MKNVLLATLTLILGCSSQVPDSVEPATNPKYPALYTDTGLPRLPNAKILDGGRQTKSLRDGIRVTLQTDQSISEVRAYLDVEMKKLGWIIPMPRIAGDMVDVSKYNDRYLQTGKRK